GTKTLNDNFTSVINYFKSADDRNEQITHRLEHAFDQVEQGVERQEEVVENISQVAENQKQFSQDVLDEQKQIEKSLASTNHSLTNITKAMGRHNEEFQRIFGRDVGRRLELVVANVRELG